MSHWLLRHWILMYFLVVVVVMGVASVAVEDDGFDCEGVISVVQGETYNYVKGNGDTRVITLDSYWSERFDGFERSCIHDAVQKDERMFIEQRGWYSYVVEWE